MIPILLLALLGAAPAADAPKVRLDSVGYLLNHAKRASIAGACTRFRVVQADGGSVVYEGAATGPVRNVDSGEDLWTADFTDVKEPGTYRVEAEGVGTSATFRVAGDVYEAPFVAATRAMYLWRCGTAVSGTYRGQTFAHGPCHLQDAWLDFVGGGHARRGSTGGWHDAGDYNKYVVNAGVTVGTMLRAWEDFGPAIRRAKLDIPDAGSLPAFLAEVRWELDWLLTMQAEDGSVFHKVSTKSFGGFVLPEKETAERYFVSWSSAATADFVAMMAMGARHLRPYDAAHADRCLAAAKKGLAFLRAHPGEHAADQKGFGTGGYTTGDADDRLWASAEVWEATGDAEALRDVEARIGRSRDLVERNWDWGDVANLGLLTYLGSKRPGRDPKLVARVRDSLVGTADGIVATSRAHGYARPLGNLYYWGCNGTVARQVVVLMAADRVEPDRHYREAALDAIHHLFGRNVHGRSYVTGLGDRPPMHPHDRRSGGDSVVEPWPGYLVGGPHPKPIDWHDEQKDYQTNEIAINWNGALIYALAAFLDGK